MKIHSLTCLALASALVAQTPACFAANDQSANVSTGTSSYSMAGPNMVGWQFMPTQAYTIHAAQFFTANTSAAITGEFMSVELWDDAGGVPNTRMGGGTWKSTAVISWQGADLDNAVTLQASTNYWIVFIDPGWSTVPIEPGGAMPLARASYSNTTNTWTATAASAPKFRLFCSPLDRQGAVPFGLPCQSSLGQTGMLFTNQDPTVGNQDFAFEGTGFPGSALTFLALGMTIGWPSIPIPRTNNCDQSIYPFATIVGTTGSGNVQSPTALGHLAFPIPLPAAPSLVGFYFDAQLGVYDAGLQSTFAIPFVTSNAMQVTVY